MTKTKKKLRAEAVERLRTMDEWCDEPHITYDFLKAMLGDSWTVSDKEKTRDALIDLLTDDEPTDEYRRGYEDGLRSNTKAAFSAAKQAFGVRKRPTNDDSDTREKLEADMNNLIHETVRNARECCTISFCWDGDMFTDLLDRQAAITERECANEYVNGWTEGSVAWILRQYEDEKLMRDVDCEAKVALATEELQAKVGELEADRDAFVKHFEQEQDLRIKITIENGKLEAENAKLREQPVRFAEVIEKNIKLNEKKRCSRRREQDYEGKTEEHRRQRRDGVRYEAR